MTFAYLLHLATMLGINMILALSLQLTMGITGLVNLGHIAFFAIGSYTSALLTLHGMPFTGAMFVSALLAGLAGLLLGVFTQRIKADYLALATLAFSYLVHALLLNTHSFTNGPLGLANITKPIIFGFQVGANWAFLIFTTVIAVSVYLILMRLIDSPLGMALQATRDNELALRVLGKSTLKLKILAFVCSGCLAGVAGSLYAHFVTFIDPASFTIMQLIPIVCLVVLGGLGSLNGTIVATFVLILISESLRFLSLPSSLTGPLTQMIYASLLFLVLIKKPQGFFGKVSLK